MKESPPYKEGTLYSSCCWFSYRITGTFMGMHVEWMLIEVGCMLNEVGWYYVERQVPCLRLTWIFYLPKLPALSPLCLPSLSSDALTGFHHPQVIIWPTWTIQSCGPRLGLHRVGRRGRRMDHTEALRLHTSMASLLSPDLSCSCKGEVGWGLYPQLRTATMAYRW